MQRRKKRMATWLSVSVLCSKERQAARQGPGSQTVCVRVRVRVLFNPFPTAKARKAMYLHRLGMYRGGNLPHLHGMHLRLESSRRATRLWRMNRSGVTSRMSNSSRLYYVLIPSFGRKRKRERGYVPGMLLTSRVCVESTRYCSCSRRAHGRGGIRQALSTHPIRGQKDSGGCSTRPVVAH